MTTKRRASPVAALAAAGLAVVALSGCAPRATEAPSAPPRLVVLMVADGVPQWQVTAYRDQLAPDGLNRFFSRGRWFSEAYYGQSNTVTAAGHATLLTGAYPDRTGIIGNEWRDPQSGERVYCAGDPDHAYIGHRTVRLSGTSPRNLMAESLGDVLRRRNPRAKVIAVSGKDRGAILPAGRDGTAYMYMRETGRFASSTYYMKSHPAWVEAFNAARPADRYFKATWSPLLPEMAYARSLPDGQRWYAPGGKLPSTFGEGLAAPDPSFYASLARSPFLDALTLEFARAALAGEALGTDDATDILVVSLSSHDYVNHSWGAESRMSHDHLLQLDDQIAAFFRDLDGRLGADGYVAVLTADHGFMPVPEHLRSLGRDAGRIAPGPLLERLEAGLARRHGKGPWVRGWSAQGVLLDRELAVRQGVAPEALEDAAAALLRAEEGLAAAFTRREVAAAKGTDSSLLGAVRKSWHPARSADVLVVPRPGWMLSSYPTGTTHGSPHSYDTHVPLLFYGPKWVKPGRQDSRVEVIDLAPTLAALLGIPAPSSSQGRPLALAP